LTVPAGTARLFVRWFREKSATLTVVALVVELDGQ
jgi:hypothetical protein